MRRIHDIHGVFIEIKEYISELSKEEEAVWDAKLGDVLTECTQKLNELNKELETYLEGKNNGTNS